MNPALVDPVAEDHFASFVQHHELVVVSPDSDVELRIRFWVNAFPEGVVCSPCPRGSCRVVLASSL